MKPNKDVVSLRIRIIKEKLGLSIAKMAEKVGTSKTNLNAYLRAVSLPPEKIAENISALGGYSDNWVYYGDNLDYIKEFLLYMGFDELIKDYPYILEEINEEYEDLLKLDGYRNWDKEDLIHTITINKYNAIFDKYILDIIEPFAIQLDSYQIDIGGKEYSRNSYILRIKNLVKTKMPIIYYGEKDRIYKLAEDQFNAIVRFYENSTEGIFKPKDIVELFANKLGSQDEIQKFLRRISNYEKVSFEPDDTRTKEFISKLHEFHTEIMNLLMGSYD